VMAGIPSLAKRSEWIREGFIHVKDPTGQPIYRLILNSDSHDYFVKNVLSHTPGPEGPTISSHSRLSTARDHFASYLKEKLKEMPPDIFQDWIKRLQDKVLQRMKVTVYTVSDQAEVGVIFEVLNNRGKPLSELEKVKNYLLYLAAKLDVVPNSLAEAVNKAWTNIFQRLMRAGITDSDSENQLLRAHWLAIYDAERKNWDGSKSIKAWFNLKKYEKKHGKLRDDLLKYAKTLDDAALVYCDARHPAHTDAFKKWDDPLKVRDQVRSFSEKLRRVNVLAPFLPLFIAARLRFPESGDQYLELVKLCEVFAFRVYRLTNHRANAGQPRLFRVGNELYHGKLTLDEALEAIRVLLYYYCPTSSFQAAIGPPDPDDPWYGWTGLKYFLYEYEEYLAKKADIPLTWEQVTRSDEQKTIEHILPQTPTPVWKDIFDAKQRGLYHKEIGNPFLTVENSAYGKKPFDQKRGTPKGESWSESPCYANSNLFMERALAAFRKWDEAALLKRRKQIVEWALQRWHVEEPEGTVDTPLDEDDDADE